MKKTVIVLIGIVVVYLLRLYEASKKLTFSLGTFSGLSLKGGSLSWKQGIKVLNGSNTTIPINSASVKNIVFGKEVGTTILSESVLIRPLETTQLFFYVAIPYDQLLTLMGGFVEAFKTKKFELNFLGDVWAAGLPLPIDQKFSVDLSKILN